MKYFSMFTGIGGFELGIKQAYDIFNRHSASEDKQEPSEILQGDMLHANEGLLQRTATCVGFSEIDKYANQLLQIKFPTVKNYGNATTIDERQLPDFDLLVGGFPCQSFSIAGKRKGFDDTRGTLFFDIARILSYKKPSHLLLENVKGLLSHDGGRTFQTIIGVLTGLGYFVEWQVLNSKNFGVPQNRERVFIIGHLGGLPRRKVFPIGQDDGLYNEPSQSDERQPQATIAGTVRMKAGKADDTYIKETQKLSDAMRVRSTDGNSVTLKGLGGGLGAKTGLYAIRKNNDVIEETEDEALCIDGNYHKGFDNHGQRTGIMQTKVIPMTWRRTEKGKEARRINQANGRDYTPFSDGHREVVPNPNKEVIGTITSQAIAKDSLVGNEMRIRRLTPKECERLQGFPDNWTAGFSDTQRYKMCGNAVTVNVVQYVISKLFL